MLELWSTRLAGRAADDAVDAVPAVAILYCRLRAPTLPFAAPAVYWIWPRHSFGDGLLLAFIGSLGLV
jgi:hypothetical protein